MKAFIPFPTSPFKNTSSACDIEKPSLAHSTDVLWNEIEPHLHASHVRKVILLLSGSLNLFEQHNSVWCERFTRVQIFMNLFFTVICLFCAQALSDRVEAEAALHNQVVDALLYLVLADEFTNHDAIQSLSSLRVTPTHAKGY